MIDFRRRPTVPPVILDDRPVLISDCGLTLTLDLDRFHAAPSLAECDFLDGLDGPVVDIGCGPGRAAAHLRQRGKIALGLDANAGLVQLARERGAHCAHQSIFDPLPFEGRWHQVLLLDGNIGIGGDPSKLLERLRTVVHPGGQALIEVEPAGGLRQVIVRERIGGRIGHRFPWATISADALVGILDGSGWRNRNRHEVDDRIIVELERIA